MKSAQNTQKTRKALKFLNEVSGRTKGSIILLALLEVALSVGSIWDALLLRNIINAAVDRNKSLFFQSVIAFILLIAAVLILRALSQYLYESAGSRLENRFKQRLFSELLYRDAGSVSAVHSGEWMNRLTGDTAQVAGAMTSIFPGLIGMIVQLAGAVFMIILLEPKFLYLVVPGGILLVLASTVFRKQMKQLYSRIREKDGLLRVYLQERLENLLLIRSYAVEKTILSDAQSYMDGHR